MDLIVPKNSLASEMRFSRIVSDVEASLLKIPNFAKYKNELEFVRHCCELVEFAVVKSDKIDKKVLVITVLTKMFNLTPEEIEHLGKQIEFLWENKNIKKLDKATVIAANVFSWFKKKFG